MLDYKTSNHHSSPPVVSNESIEPPTPRWCRALLPSCIYLTDTLPHEHHLVLMASCFHFHFQLLSSFLDVAIYLFLLLLLHFYQSLPTHGVFIFKAARLCKPRRLLTLPVKQWRASECFRRARRNQENCVSNAIVGPFNRHQFVCSSGIILFLHGSCPPP